MIVFLYNIFYLIYNHIVLEVISHQGVTPRGGNGEVQLPLVYRFYQCVYHVSCMYIFSLRFLFLKEVCMWTYFFMAVFILCYGMLLYRFILCLVLSEEQ